MSIKGATQELYVGKEKSTIVTFWGNRKEIEYDDLKRIDYMYAAKTESGYLDFIGNDNKAKRFDFEIKSNEKITRTINLIRENNIELEICEYKIENLKFYQRSFLGALLSFVLGFPLGLIGIFLIWHYKKGSRYWRSLITIAAISFWSIWGYVSYVEYKSAMNNANAAIEAYQNTLNGVYSGRQNSESDENHKESVMESSNSKYEDIYNASTYKIGQDMPAGEYVLFSDGSETNYFAVASDSSGALTSILANGAFNTNTIVTADEGQYFNFTGCYAVPITEATELDTTKEGMFKVGVHLKPGEYQLWASDGADTAYYAVMKDSTHKMSSIEVNGIIEGRTYVTIEKGDYLELQGCYIIE